MEVTDLMVGDWVYISGKPVKITKGKLAMLLFLDDNPEISPIPLTEEILVRNGFRIQVIHDNGKWLWMTDNSWLSYSERHNYWYYEDMKITYVHQLQHLLQLCGIEKEITL